jgi:hypothetical protein
MAATFGYLTDVRPYKTSWRVQVKTLHAWRQYTANTGETLEVVFSDETCGVLLLNKFTEDVTRLVLDLLFVFSGLLR